MLETWSAYLPTGRLAAAEYFAGAISEQGATPLVSSLTSSVPAGLKSESWESKPGKPASTGQPPMPSPIVAVIEEPATVTPTSYQSTSPAGLICPTAPA